MCDIDRHAFATLITSDSYLNGALALVKTLQTHSSSFQIVVLVTPNVSNATLKRLNSQRGVRTKVVEPISRPVGSSNEHCWANSQYTKLHIWNLMEFTRIVYIDADCIVLGNIDELFDLTPRDEEIFAASPDVFPPDKFNAGVMVITPNEDLFALLVVASSNLTSYDDGDTGLLNAFFHMWYNTESIEIQALRNKLLQYHPQFPEVNQSKIKLIRLPFGYNAQRTMHHFTKANPRYWKSISPLKVIHFCSSPKPWESGLGSKLCGELERLWWEAFMS